MAYLHSDVKCFDIHVAHQTCEIVIQSATIVAILDQALRRQVSGTIG